MKPVYCLILVLFSTVTALQAQVDVLDSGGLLMYEQAAYDVTHYDLNLKIFPDKQSIQGHVTVDADVVHPMHWLVLDLDPRLTVSQIAEVKDNQEQKRDYHRNGGKLWINLENTRNAGEAISVRISYSGKPRVAPMAPWDGGFVWAKTTAGEHWIATANQTNGADLWWPVKDHVSDEPNTVDLHITVPEPLFVATNGKFVRQEKHKDESITYHWKVNNPINAYNISLNIAPYEVIESKLNSVSGDEVPVFFYVLPDDIENGKQLMPEIIEHLEFYEKYLGPYPFRSDKYGVVQTPHLGMEHQTIIAYGADFDNTAMTRGPDWGFDALHHHELGHEWWGNLVTNYDWRDMWIHEGFCSYMQPLYLEDTQGKEAYQKYLRTQRRFSNTLAVAPREITSAQDIYKAPIYNKGAWILHTLRYLLGDEVFFKSLRRMAYPDPALERVTDGSQTRFVTTDDFKNICEEISGRKLDWFFEVYLRQPKLPILNSKIKDGQLTLRWMTPIDTEFPMLVEVEINGKVKKYEIPKDGLVIDLPSGARPVVDPNDQLLFDKN